MRSLAICALAFTPALLFANEAREHTIHRVDVSARVFDEIMRTPDHAIPRDLLDHARCIGIVPAYKRVGFIVGADYGKGVVVCRDERFGGWSGPSAIVVEGGSFGLQIGAGETDLVFLVMNGDGMRKMSEDKFEIGGDASAMAGPVGRTAQAKTDLLLHAEILAYSRSRGLFAGISLQGSSIRPDHKDNEALYGRAVTQREILFGRVRPPRDARMLVATLDRFTRAAPHVAQR